MAVSQSLTISEVEGSVNTTDNTSKVNILWISTQTGESRNDYTRTAKYYVSVNGGTETEYSVSYTLPQNTEKTIVDTTLTVKHKSDGTGEVSVRTWMDTRISAGVVTLSEREELTSIARGSEITSAADVTLGNACSIKWTPKNKAYWYKLKFSLGSWSHTTAALHPGQTSAYTYNGYIIPLGVAKQIPNAKTGTMTVELTTYSDSAATTQLGAATSATFKVTVPNSSETKPSVTMTLSPSSSLPTAFAGLYIQGKTKVAASLSATAKYSASVESYSLSVEGKSYDADDNYTSAYLSQYGSLTVKGSATDSRGYTGSKSEKINVIAYSKPKIVAEAFRCDSGGTASDAGTYLKIVAKRTYSKVKVDGTQKNFCLIRYRYKLSGGSYSAWTTILARTSLTSDEVTTGALLSGALDVKSSYVVQVQAVDDLDESASTTIDVSSETVYMHKDGARRSLTFGGYVEEDNTFAIAEDIEFKVKSEKWTSMGLSANVSATESSYGRAPSGCRYRVVNGTHVFVEFNCAFSYTKDNVVLSGSSLPKKYRPPRNVYSICSVNGKAVARAFVTTAGAVYIGWVRDLTSDSSTYDVTWIDGHIDFFIS